MIARIASIVFIFICTTIAWVILGATIFHRTFDSDANLRGKVESSWGTAHTQERPHAWHEEQRERQVETKEDNKVTHRTVTETITHALPLESSAVDVTIDLEHRQKGLLWYSTYRVALGGEYTFRNNTSAPRDIFFRLPLPAQRAMYDDLVFLLDGQPVTVEHTAKGVQGMRRLDPGATAVLKVGYRSHGLGSWRYSFGEDVSEVRNFRLHAVTNFKGLDFAEDTLSPTEKTETADGWDLTWTYKNLVSGFQIGVTMPEKIQPGPLAGRISFFAPVSLFFFFFLMFLITTIRGIPLHPLNYFFLAAAFFAFHLLLAYLVDHISIHAAFLISSLTSVFLVISYLRLVTGLRFAAMEAGLTQLVYLVLFSYAFFFEGFTGLTITIGSILTLFVVMQMTGRINWEEKFTVPARIPPVPSAR